MNRDQAAHLISDAFARSFDKNRFLPFIRNLLNTIDESKAQAWSQQYVKDAYKPGIARYERLATYVDPDGEKVDILIVNLKKATGLERARTFQRNFVADYLVTRGQKEAALVAFVPPDGSNWRFSLVKMEYAAAQTETGRVKVEEKLTPARRYSYLVGENEASHTAQSQLVSILQDSDRNPTLKNLEDAFSIERVTNEFFGQYKHLLICLKQALDTVLRNDACAREEFAAKDISRVDFVKKLLGQIVFLYFLQKKGWFGVPKDGQWGDGPRDFLRQLFCEKIAPYTNLFNDVLEPLFYEALAKERDEDFYSRFRCKIPFLNGGLFDPIRGYDWVHTDILLPDHLFSNDDTTKMGDKGTGILDIFDRYNFTVNEAEPLETEVAIDPEFLGRIFEKLNAINDKNFDRFQKAEETGKDSEIREFNKKNGVYYTPRDVVHYMCRQALSYHLETAVQGHCSRDDIDEFLTYGEQAADFEANPTQKHKDKRLPDAVRDHASELDAVLRDVRVCDPAVGSGAFPVGMLTEIVRARLALNSVLGAGKSRSRYEFKRHAIQECLYGVDIDPGAVEIAKLRLWLSLVVDEDDIRSIRPLPNLDYKIMQGDSLLDRFEGHKLFDDRLLAMPELDAEREKEALKQRQSAVQKEYIQLSQSGKLTKFKKIELDRELSRLDKALAELTKGSGSKHVNDDWIENMSESRFKLKELREKHDAFFGAVSRKQKESIKQDLDELEWDFMEATLSENDNKIALRHLQKLRNSSAKPFFLWQLHFVEVFQERGGFDIMVGNPPYVRADGDEEHARHRQQIMDSGFYETLWEKWDLYVPFIERGYKFLRPDGVITFIVSDAFCHAKYAEKPQKWYLKNARVLRMDFLSKLQIFEAGVHNVAFFFSRTHGCVNRPERRLHDQEFGQFTVLDTNEQANLDYRVFFPEDADDTDYAVDTKPLDALCYLTVGMVVNAHERLAPGEFTMADLLSDKRDPKHSKRFAEGKQLDAWLPRHFRWLEWGTERAPGLFRRPTFPEIYAAEEKILVQRSPGPDPKACYDDMHIHFTESAVGCIPWHSLAGTRNRSLQKSARYADEKPRPDLPKREQLEETGRQFDVKYLVAVMNSTVARDYLRAHRRSNIHLYPDDWKKLPIPDVPKAAQAPIVKLVDKILTAKRADPDADIADLEAKVDAAVTALYGVEETTTKGCCSGPLKR